MLYLHVEIALRTLWLTMLFTYVTSLHINQRWSLLVILKGTQTKLHRLDYTRCLASELVH